MLSDVNGICRLCLKCDGTIIPIFGRENTSRDCIHLSKKILDCVSVKVKEQISWFIHHVAVPLFELL